MRPATGAGRARRPACRARITALGRALQATAPARGGIERGLHALHRMIAMLEDDVLIAADYGARIARMLGLS